MVLFLSTEKGGPAAGGSAPAPFSRQHEAANDALKTRHRAGETEAQRIRQAEKQREGKGRNRLKLTKSPRRRLEAELGKKAKKERKNER